VSAVEETDEPSPRLVLSILAATFALGTVIWVAMVQPDRHDALKGGLVFLAMGLTFLGVARLAARVLRGSADQMTPYFREYNQAAADFFPVVATAMLPCGVVLLLSAPLR
jgi:hypothetical protein